MGIGSHITRLYYCQGLRRRSACPCGKHGASILSRVLALELSRVLALEVSRVLALELSRVLALELSRTSLGSILSRINWVSAQKINTIKIYYKL